jgi:hypothetical protein
MNYVDFVSRLAEGLTIRQTDADFITLVPATIDAAEQRCYRELDLQNTIVRNSSAVFTPGTRTLNLPSTLGTFKVIENIYAITPAGQVTPDLGTRNELMPTSRPFLTATYPSSNGSTVPAYFAMVTDTTIIVGPWPDQAYQVEVTGTIRPLALSSSNVTTLLTMYFPDLFLAGALSFAWNLQGEASTTGQLALAQAQAWEANYQSLYQSAQVEEGRKKFTMEGWSSKAPAPQATPPRT